MNKAAIDRLGAPRSAERRAAAKALRRHPSRGAGRPILAAAMKEIRDPRTWETQYQMMMALGACGYQPALPVLRRLKYPELPHMVVCAIGDSILRLWSTTVGTTRPLRWVLSRSCDPLLEGALRAVAMERLPVAKRVASDMLRRTREAGFEASRAWAAAAVMEWDLPQKKAFLKWCVEHGPYEAAYAAQASLDGVRPRWKIL
ncbi:MAG: hypothetical protein ACJ78V_04785 [Myxococcales bacterium]